jgi:hypothetical protein
MCTWLGHNGVVVLVDECRVEVGVTGQAFERKEVSVGAVGSQVGIFRLGKLSLPRIPKEIQISSNTDNGTR